MKKVILFLIVNCFTAPIFCQALATDHNPGSSNLQFNPQSTFPSSGFHGRANSFANPTGLLNMITGKFNLKVPTRFHYSIAGVDFQAGLMMNTKQPKLGAGFTLPHGFNFSAGYGVSMPNMNRMGYSPFSKNQGIQISASYRLFRKK